jgi:CSLREA domain-containing protein
MPARGMRAVGMVAVLALVASILTATGAFLAVAPAGAANATILVTTTADTVDDTDGVLSLREAVVLANQQSGADTIQLAPAAHYLVTRCGVVPGGSLEASDPAGISLTGAGSTITVCNGGGLRFTAGPVVLAAVTLLGPGSGIVMDEAAVPQPVPFHLDHVTIEGSAGDCVRVGAQPATIDFTDVGLRDCVGAGLVAPTSGQYFVPAQLTRVEITGAHAGASLGGATIESSSIHDNHGGGLRVERATVARSHFDRNSGGTIGGLAVGVGAVGPPPTATITDSTFDGNAASDNGGLYVRGTLHLTSSSITGNSVTNGTAGLEIVDASLVLDGPHSIEASHIDDNTATTGTGGITVGATVTGPSPFNPLIVRSSTIDRNQGSLSSALELYNPTTLQETSVSGNAVTAAATAGYPPFSGTITMNRSGPLVVSSSTIAGNTTKMSATADVSAGAINGIGDLTLERSTVTGNVGDTGGVAVAGVTTIDRSTLTDNVGGTVSDLQVWGRATVTASVVATSLPTSLPVCAAGNALTIESKGFNFDSGHSCGFGKAPAGRVDFVDAGDPRLGPLAANGGPTKTRLPAVGSPVVDRIPSATDGVCTAADQRGVPRPQGPACDIGAVEGSSGARYHPVAPTRILDSRTVTGGWASSKLVAGSPRLLTVAGVAGGVVPSSASAVVVNVTVTGSSAPSFLTVSPAGRPTPNASNLNFAAGQTIPNLVTTQIGAGGAIALATAAGATDVVVDLVGWFDDGRSAGDRFTPLPPARLLDSRTATGGWNGSKLVAGAARDLVIGGRGGVPSTATAAVLNITVTESSSPTFVTAWPKGQSQPVTSNLNVAAGETIPNLAVVPLGTDGSIRIATAVGQVDVIVDVVGSYDPGAGGVFHPMPPTRILDDRVGLGAPGPWGPAQARTIPITGAATTAIVANVTATNATVGTFVTAFPSGSVKPATSNLNVGPGQTIPNLVVVGVASVGGASNGFQLHNALGSVDLIADVSGYYTSS